MASDGFLNAGAWLPSLTESIAEGTEETEDTEQRGTATPVC
jgi:hypothetical protein